MAVITISREFGTYGEQIAQRLAELRKMPLIDKDAFTALLSEYGMLSFDDFYEVEASRMERFRKEKENYVKLLNEAILAYAKQDHIVIQGRGGFAVLQAYSNVLNVLIKGPFDKRVREFMGKSKIENQQEAAKRVEQNDRVRNSFLQTYYRISMNDASRFDLVIDSAAIPMEMALRWIQEAADLLDQAQPGIRNTRTIEVDTVMEESVVKAMKR